MADIPAALRMLDTFTSVAADSFVVTKTELEWPGHKKVIWGKTYSVPELREKLPPMVRTAAQRRSYAIPESKTMMAGENLILRPIRRAVSFIQLDDLTEEQLNRIRPAVFLLHTTSPGNYQGWIAVSGVPEGKEAFKEFMRRVRKAVGGNDKSASHATRVAGTENFKVKYGPNFPTVTLVETHPGRILTREQLEGLGLLAAPDPVSEKTVSFTPRIHQTHEKTRHWPSYEMSLAQAPPSNGGSGPDRSRADFWWCYLALQRKWRIEDTEAKLLEVSEKARERVRIGDPGYVHQTVINAAAAVERGKRSRA